MEDAQIFSFIENFVEKKYSKKEALFLLLELKKTINNFDSYIKTIHGLLLDSPTEQREQVILFKEMVTEYISWMKKWFDSYEKLSIYSAAEEVLDKNVGHKIAHNRIKSGADGLEKYNYVQEEDFLFTRPSELFHPDLNKAGFLALFDAVINAPLPPNNTGIELMAASPFFNVSTSLIGLCALLSRSPPSTIGDVFTGAHQNLEYLTNNLLAQCISLNDLPTPMQKVWNHLSAEMIHPTSSLQIAGLHIQGNILSLQLNLPLRNHAATFVISFNKKTQKTYLEGNLLGHNHQNRWNLVHLLLHLYTAESGREFSSKITTSNQYIYHFDFSLELGDIGSDTDFIRKILAGTARKDIFNPFFRERSDFDDALSIMEDAFGRPINKENLLKIVPELNTDMILFLLNPRDDLFFMKTHELTSELTVSALECLSLTDVSLPYKMVFAFLSQRSKIPSADKLVLLNKYRQQIAKDTLLLFALVQSYSPPTEKDALIHKELRKLCKKAEISARRNEVLNALEVAQNFMPSKDWLILPFREGMCLSSESLYAQKLYLIFDPLLRLLIAPLLYDPTAPLGFPEDWIALQEKLSMALDSLIDLTKQLSIAIEMAPMGDLKKFVNTLRIGRDSVFDQFLLSLINFRILAVYYALTDSQQHQDPFGMMWQVLDNHFSDQWKAVQNEFVLCTALAHKRINSEGKSP